jgi:hypothetical protein
MRPLGGGDPIPLKKPEMVIGRRKSCDIRLDFENISGRHCQLRFLQGVWHVRDLNSTNGTTVNGQLIFSEHELMPDDSLGVSGHMFMIDYDPVAPTSLMDAKLILEEELAEEGGRRRSLMEMAGLGSDVESSYRSSRAVRSADLLAAASAVISGENVPVAPANASDPAAIEAVAPSLNELNDDEFLALIRDDIETGEHPSKKR